MSVNFNNPNFGNPAVDSNNGHFEPENAHAISNVDGYEHPFFTSVGSIMVVNAARNFANSANEKPLSGEVKPQVFTDIGRAAYNTKFPYDLLMFAVDWEQDLTARSGAQDADGIARKMLQYVPGLRSTFGRDPLNAEVWMAHVVNGPGKVKEIYDLHIKKPEEEAKPPGSKKDDVLIWKKRGEGKQKRTNRELYDFFYRRIPVGKILFKKNLGSNGYTGGGTGGSSNPLGGLGGFGNVGGGGMPGGGGFGF